MKLFKNWKALTAVLMVCLLAATLFGCAEQPAGDPTYRVSVKDAQGAPYTSGVIVRFMQGGQQAAMQTIDEQGVASKTLPAGEYTVELMFTSDSTVYHYDASNVLLTAEAPEGEVILSLGLGENSRNLYAQGEDVDAYDLTDGCTYVELTQGRNYFLFTPQTAGTYRFALLNCDGQIGYYGAPHFVQAHSAAETVDNAFTMSIKADMIGSGNTGTTVMVVGVDVEQDCGGIIAITRIGDPERGIEDEPWIIYKTTTALAAFTLPEGTVKDFDLTAENYTLVLDEKGWYHLDTVDGPLVLAKIGAASAPGYIDPFETILDRSGVSKYFFDENGEFVKRENYSDCLLEYISNCHEASGLYPLTEDLKYIIQQRGDHSGWFGTDESLYLFKDEDGLIIPNINPEISWLFMCCYLEN